MNCLNICIVSSLVTVLVVLPSLPPLLLVLIVAGIRPGMLLPLLRAMFASCYSSFASNAAILCVCSTATSMVCRCVSSRSLVWSITALACSFRCITDGSVKFICISLLKCVFIPVHVVAADLFHSRHASLRSMCFSKVAYAFRFTLSFVTVSLSAVTSSLV